MATSTSNEKMLFHDTTGRTPAEIAELKARLRDTYSDDFSITSQGIIQKVKKKKAKVRCITKAMAEDFSREQLLLSSFIETIIYVIFATACCIHIFNLKSYNMYYMNAAMTQGFFTRPFPGELDVDGLGSTEINFVDISTISNMWQFITLNFIHAIYFDTYFNGYSTAERNVSLNVLYENVILGVPRIRQVRVRDNSCQIHPYFSRLFKQCFGTYSAINEDTSTFGLGRHTAWVYSDQKTTLNIKTSGEIANYGGGGYYMDLNRDGSRAREEMNELRRAHWITRNTRAVFLSFSFYNANLNLFGICRILFELPPTGGVIPSYHFYSLKLLPSSNTWSYFIRACETIYYIFIFVYIIQSIRELIYFKLRYFTRFWSYIDCIITGLSLHTLVLTNHKRADLDGEIRKIRENPLKYGNLEHIGQVQNMHDDLSAVVFLFVFIRFFKYLNFNRTMGQLNDTLKKCARDVFGFSIMFFIIFFAYAELGFLLFGSQVRSFRTFGHSMFTLLRTILGDFDYEAIESAHRVLAPIYFLTYIMLVFFILLNMFLAIINDTYSDVKTEIALAPTELQMIDYLKNHVMKILHKCRFIRMKPKERKSPFLLTADEIRKALEKCGFSYLEIEMFFARYNINPLAIVTEYDVNKLIAELESVVPGTADGKGAGNEGNIHIEELMIQKEQLIAMEKAMFELGTKVDSLIRLLEKLGAEVKVEPNEKKKKGDSSESSERYSGYY